MRCIAVLSCGLVVLFVHRLARADDVPPGTSVTSAKNTPTPPPVGEPAQIAIPSETVEVPVFQIPFTYTFHGFIRGGYTYIPYNPNDSQLVGHDSGFRLDDTRLEFSGAFGRWVDFDLSIDSASTIDPTTGLAPVQVAFEDAYTTLHDDNFYLRFGQFKTPFNGEFLLDDQYIPFTRRSAVTEGLAVDESNTPEPGILLDRQLGAMIGARVPVAGKAAFSADFAAVNGNGANEARNDNPALAYVLRATYGTPSTFVAIAGYENELTEGTLAQRQDERDLAGDVDFSISTGGFRLGRSIAHVKVFGMGIYKNAFFPTVPQNARVESWGGVGSVSMPVAVGPLVVEPAVRYTYFLPDSTLRTPTDNGTSGTPFVLQDATFGVNLSPQVIPLRFQINYTDRIAAAIWEQPGTLVEVVLQANF